MSVLVELVHRPRVEFAHRTDARDRAADATARPRVERVHAFARRQSLTGRQRALRRERLARVRRLADGHQPPADDGDVRARVAQPFPLELRRERLLGILTGLLRHRVHQNTRLLSFRRRRRFGAFFPDVVVERVVVLLVQRVALLDGFRKPAPLLLRAVIHLLLLRLQKRGLLLVPFGGDGVDEDAENKREHRGGDHEPRDHVQAGPLVRRDDGRVRHLKRVLARRHDEEREKRGAYVFEPEPLVVQLALASEQLNT
mmetsp:Transcript_2421/g.9469  ORF Transcript_2421/g.9469 Transcript_2421/m.9469 type:complete len:257 (-) Transcript_2421:694-1464(-)